MWYTTFNHATLKLKTAFSSIIPIKIFLPKNKHLRGKSKNTLEQKIFFLISKKIILKKLKRAKKTQRIQRGEQKEKEKKREKQTTKT